jgi:hypothetical protein
MGQRLSSEQSVPDLLQQGDPAASGASAPLREQASGSFADSPRQVAQRQIHDSLQNSPRQVMQRQHLNSLQHAHSQPSTRDSAVVQRAIKGSHKFTNGELSIDMVPSRRMSNGDSYGEEGLIRFMPAEKAAKMDDIDLVQTVRSKENGEDVAWDGEEAIREAWKAGGRFVDRSGGDLDVQRGADSGQPVSAAYNAGNRQTGGKYHAGAERHRATPTSPLPQIDITPGHNNAKGRKVAELWDHPSSTRPTSYEFETEVVAKKEGSAPTTWGAVRWSFSTQQTRPAGSFEPSWNVANESHTFHEGTSAQHEAAKARFDEVEGNKGLLNPDNIKAVRERFVAPATRETARGEINLILAKAKEYIDLMEADESNPSRKRFESIRERLEAFVHDIDHPPKSAWDDDEPAPRVAGAPPISRTV